MEPSRAQDPAAGAHREPDARPADQADAADLADLAEAWPVADLGGDDYRRASLGSTRLLDALPLRLGAGGRAAVVVAGDGASDGLRTVPAVADPATDGGWRRARAGDGLAAALVRRFVEGGGAQGAFVLDALGPVDVGAGVEQAIGVDQTNVTLIVDGRVGVKWLDAPDPARDRAPRLSRHLAAAGFREMPALLSTLAWRPDADRPAVTLAMVDVWLPDARDGWDWCVEALELHLSPTHACGDMGSCPAAFAVDLGGLVARLHLALATPTDVIPAPVARVGADVVARWATAARASLALAIELTTADDPGAGAELSAAAGVLQERLAALEAVGDTMVQEVHGDLHVGQVLAGPHGLAVIDLDGNPTLDARTAMAQAPAARDVAGMLCSLDHVGRIAVRRGAGTAAAAAWIASAQAAFLEAYQSGLSAGGRPQLLDERLIAPFMVEQSCRDLVYAARHLPRWRYAPLGTIRAMVSQ